MINHKKVFKLFQKTELVWQLCQPENSDPTPEKLSHLGVHQPVFVQGPSQRNETALQQHRRRQATRPRHPQRKVHYRRRRQR